VRRREKALGEKGAGFLRFDCATAGELASISGVQHSEGGTVLRNMLSAVVLASMGVCFCCSCSGRKSIGQSPLCTARSMQ